MNALHISNQMIIDWAASISPALPTYLCTVKMIEDYTVKNLNIPSSIIVIAAQCISVFMLHSIPIELLMNLTDDEFHYLMATYLTTPSAVIEYNKENPKGVYTFGTFIGSPDEGGAVVIDAELDSVIAIGQRDYRKPANTTKNYYIVHEN